LRDADGLMQNVLDWSCKLKPSHIHGLVSRQEVT